MSRDPVASSVLEVNSGEIVFTLTYGQKGSAVLRSPLFRHLAGFTLCQA